MNQPPNWDHIRQTLQEIAALLDETEIAPETRAAILARRSRQFAQPATPATIATTSSQAFLTFGLSVERYAIAVQQVRAIAVLRRLTPVPCVPHFYRGVTNLNGKITSVFDLRRFFELEIADAAPTMGIVVMGAGLEIALLVESVEGVQQLDPNEFVLQEFTAGIAGVTADGLILLDIDRLFREPRLRIYEEPI